MKRRYDMIGFVFLAFFVMSLLTNILGALVPDIIASFQLTLTAAAVLPFSFFIAYGVMSIPAGLLIEAYREKPVTLAAFLLSLAGTLLFAMRPGYAAAVVSLFLIGAGMAVLQVVLNPLLRAAGGEEHFAFNSAFAQLVFGSASFLSPRLYSYLVTGLSSKTGNDGRLLDALARLAPARLPWVSMYWIFAMVSAVMLLIVAVSRFPAIERSETERAGSWRRHRELLKNPLVVLYFIGVFLYVGSEQGTANWISQFLSVYHRYDPQVTGANAVSWFWGLLTVGCLVGMLLLKLFDSRRVLVGGALGAMVSLTAALFGRRQVALVAFPMVGLFASVIWPVTVSLALNSVSKEHGAFSGILCTGIAGGALVPLVIGGIGDDLGLRAGMTVLYATFGWSLIMGFWARPIIVNKTLQWRRRPARASVVKAGP
ncbi:MAG: MFS transporter [Acidobacteriota bacterium]